MLYSLMQFFEEVDRHGDKGDPADNVFAFLKAFYKELPQKKLSYRGMRGKVFTGINNCLKCTKHKFVIKLSTFRGKGGNY